MRVCISPLLDPGNEDVFDLETELVHAAEANKAMDERPEIKALISIDTKEKGR